MDVTKISELDPSDLKETLSFLNLDFNKYVQQAEDEHFKIREQLQKDYKYHMRSESNRLKSFFSFDPCSTWSPLEMASAGFYRTGVKDSIQCFCCGLVLCTQSIAVTPLGKHQKFQPDCDFLRGKDVGNILKYDVRVQNPEEDPAEDPGKYKAEEDRLKSYNSWPFYARTQPMLLAAAGFFFTGVKDTVQCFSCRGCLGNWEEEDDPWKEHAKWFPECEFLQSNKSQNEIKNHIQDYPGFVGVKGKHFTTQLIQKTSQAEKDDPVCNIFEDEAVRLESFKTWTKGTATDAEALAKAGFFYTGSVISNIYEDKEIRLHSFKTWPQNTPVDPADLVKAGFFYTGVSDTVRCFSCGTAANNFEPGDDPWIEHMKFKSKCKYMASSTPVEEHKVTEPTSLLSQKMNCKMMEEDPDSLPTGMALNEPQWLEDAKKLNREMTRRYNNIKFRKVTTFGESTHVAIDLKTLYADISIISKDTRNQPVQQLTLPEVLANLSSITMIEGEAGSGKTALLRKIAILWASGCCPILSKFSLVFYLSLKSTEREQSLADIICKQLALAGSPLPLTELTLKNIIQQLKNQALFLLDDFSEMNSVPSVIEELMQKNHLNRLCLVVAVCTDRSGQVRQYAKTVLSIREFPLYSTVYMLKRLFSHNVPLVRTFFIALAQSKSLQAVLKTPLFMHAHCAFKVQYPNDKVVSDTVMFKAYLLYNTLKFPKEGKKVEATLSLCGELALRGLFASCFDFTEEHLAETAVNEDDALRLGLLSKFTTQRLHPVYRFFHPSFQEFLAGKRMGELLESDLQEEQEQGFRYLQQINTFLKVVGQYYYFLTYACISSKATPKIISHLFSLMDNKESFECQSGSKEHLKQHPELELMEQVLILHSSFHDLDSVVSHMMNLLLNFAIKAANETKTLVSCAPIILQFLKGKKLNLYVQSLISNKECIVQFLESYPECLSVLSSIEIIINRHAKNPTFDFSNLRNTFMNFGQPTVEQDYSSAFQLLDDFANRIMKMAEEQYAFTSLFQDNDMINRPVLSVQNHKVPVLKIKATNAGPLSKNDYAKVLDLLSVCDRIDLQLSGNHGFVESVRPAIEQYRDFFRRCSLHDAVLSVAEQELLLSMFSVESLEINSLKETTLPEHLLSNLDKFSCLKELSIQLSESLEVFQQIPDGLKNICTMEKLVINAKFGTVSSRLVEFIQHFSSLEVFHLNCTSFPDFEALMIALSSYKKLKEIKFSGSFFGDKEISFFASALPHFTSLKVLILSSQHVSNKEALKMIANVLGSLVHLEELELPEGTATLHAAKSIIHQFPHLPRLKFLKFNNSLDDESIMELAKAAKDGYLQNLQNLWLVICNDVTEVGWRNFFKTLDNLPNLAELNVCKLFTHQIKCHATTVMAFVQCVSKLPSLVTIQIYGWLLDDDDLEMFNNMKQQHPNSKSLIIARHWTLPLPPTLQE
ncbi:LOW QUALITY PROTEIN: baculoviral IAP repeat-containing protein 1-like [Microcaecilia unicolor]|uniref:LOW QUALITY PROTEIN: baculoviral IAP repeat-containing protein 1-like n=1 Tax=Microcaecilia unicolor TaxID=1415580 RepID=A0A6P7X0V5_9AMPH|nr:LOW QUALITY PROTEIN: baculoviral IAP repeat-containing protein 1-like [Microcaecilia unicolor]